MTRPSKVVRALIRRDDAVLMAQSGSGKALGGNWEFTGDKLEPGESPIDALIREVDEELGCRIKVGEHGS